MVPTLLPAVRSALLSSPEVTRLTSLRRSTSLYSQDQPADSLYFIEDGLVKLTRTNGGGNRIILTVHGPGDLIGEEVFAEGSPTYYADAEVLTVSTLFRIPRELALRVSENTPSLMGPLITYMLTQKVNLAKKVELLCLHDVEYRILHYLTELSSLVKPTENDDSYQLPITQLELADLVGATRETTSTTLNQLERRGLVKLSRRLLTVPDPATLREAANARLSPVEASAGSV